MEHYPLLETIGNLAKWGWSPQAVKELRDEFRGKNAAVKFEASTEKIM